MLDEILRRAEQGGFLAHRDLVRLLTVDDREFESVREAAYRVKLREIGPLVSLRGLIEIGNVCRKNCFYCGIRSGNREVRRYELTEDQIVAAARIAVDYDYGSLVLQGGERSDAPFVELIERAVRRIKALPGKPLGITLSLGEQSFETYRRWREAGAHRYLLRIEASSRELYAKLHPADHSYDDRVAALHMLRDAGYQVGTGVMSGLPWQTVDDLAGDIEFFRELDVDMIGMGPYIVHHATPLGREFPDFGRDPAKQLGIGLRMIAATRLAMPTVNIASTTALQTLSADGRERGLLTGANVIMPNIGVLEHRKDYLLYENKPGTDENADEARRKLEKAIGAIGETIRYGEWGDSHHFAERTKKGVK
ncbi:MAG: [FeFe] hydrogenase H-cluster radical SAM maturase HydE [Victivallaceae bacterium]|nr:[FeFe] hydrogenase H-cluster radical SAM maturase HydE [Victivallaceae bacterium]